MHQVKLGEGRMWFDAELDRIGLGIVLNVGGSMVSSLEISQRVTYWADMKSSEVYLGNEVKDDEIKMSQK